MDYTTRIDSSLEKLDLPRWAQRDKLTNYTRPRAESYNRLGGGWSGLSSSSLNSANQYLGIGGGNRLQVRSSCSTHNYPSSHHGDITPTTTYYPSGYLPYRSVVSASASPSYGKNGGGMSPNYSQYTSRYSSSQRPYLGWRKASLGNSSIYKSPSERLAEGLRSSQSSIASADSNISTGSSVTGSARGRKERVRLNIKQVSHAIVSYVNEGSRNCVWLESSFVGSKPVESAESPPRSGSPANRLPRVTMATGAAASVDHGNGEDDDDSSELQLSNGWGKKRATNEDDGRTATPAAVVMTTTNKSEEETRQQVAESPHKLTDESPTLEDILDSLLALRRSKKKVAGEEKAVVASQARQDSYTQSPPSSTAEKSIKTELEFSPMATTTTAKTKSQSRNKYDECQVHSPPPTPSKSKKSRPPQQQQIKGAATRRPSSPPPPTPPTLSTTVAMETTTAQQPATQSETKTRDSPTFAELYSAPLDDSILILVGGGEHQISHDDDGEDRVAIATSQTTKDISSTVADSEQVDKYNNDDAFLKKLEESISVTSTAAGGQQQQQQKTRRVSFDLAEAPGAAGEGSATTKLGGGGGGRKSSEGGPTTPQHGLLQQRICKYPKCPAPQQQVSSRDSKTCHNCNAYYCSRECRRLHWDKHKRLCMQSRVGALCKQIINRIKEDASAVGKLSRVAIEGFRDKDRGAVKLFFSSPERVERYLSGSGELPEAWYLPSEQLLSTNSSAAGSSTSSSSPSHNKTSCNEPTPPDLPLLLNEYNPLTRFIIYVSICVVNEVPTSGAVRWERELVSRVSKCRLLERVGDK